MAITLDPQAQSIEQERRRIGRLLDEVAKLCEADLPPSSFYGEMLKRLLDALAAPAGAVYLRSAQGGPQQIYQINAAAAGLDKNEASRHSHETLLFMALAQRGPVHLLPQSGLGPVAEGKVPPGNPTDFILLLVPILLDEQTVGLIEVFQSPNRPLNAVNGFLQYMGLMADLCTRYERHQKVTKLTGQQTLWTQLEAFARQIHSTLNPVEVAYIVANEGRRLIDCDRVGVAVRYGSNVRVEAVSGADVVERRSNLVQLMTRLADSVLAWGEKLIFRGEKDDGLPPKVLEALDGYLAESGSKLLVVQPLRDEREGEGASKKKPRSVLVMEAFDPPAEPQQLIDRLDVVGRHAASALYNAVEHRRIPMRFVWMPLAAVQEGLGGKARAIWLSVFLGLTFLISILCLWTYPLKMEANGQLMPVVRRQVYPTREGKIGEFSIKPNASFLEDTDLVPVFDPKLRDEMDKVNTEISNALREKGDAEKAARDAEDAEARAKANNEVLRQENLFRAATQKRQTMIEAYNAEPNSRQAGVFYLRAPRFTQEEAAQLGAKKWTVLNANFSEEWSGRTGRPDVPVMRLGAKEGPWEVELKIPQKHIGQVLGAFKELKKDPKDPKNDFLEVDYLVKTETTHTFKGRLFRNRIASQADAHKEEGSNENEPVVLAYVQIFRENDTSVPENYRLPDRFLTSGAEVHAKVRCGDRSMGYSLFYGVWEFLYEKVVFFF